LSSTVAGNRRAREEATAKAREIQRYRTARAQLQALTIETARQLRENERYQ
jgi:hypothetical protein